MVDSGHAGFMLVLLDRWTTDRDTTGCRVKVFHGQRILQRRESVFSLGVEQRTLIPRGRCPSTEHRQIPRQNPALSLRAV